MGGKYLRLKVGDDEYEMPEEEAFGAMHELEKSGTKFDAVEAPSVRGEVIAGAPEVIKTPKPETLSAETGARAAETAPGNVENKPEEPRPWYQTLLDTVRATPGPGDMLGNEAARGLAGGFHHGMTMGAGAVLPGKLGEAYKELDNDAQDAAPGLYKAADLAGTMATPAKLSTTGGAGAQIFTSAADAGLNAGVRSYSDSSDADPTSRAIQALKDARNSAGVAGALSGLTHSVGGITGWLGDKAGAGADASRIKSWNVPEAEIAERAAKAGIPAEAAASELVRQGEGMVPPNKLFPRSQSSWAQGFGDKTKEYGRGIGETIDEATAAGAQLPPDPRGDVAQSLYQQADKAMTAGRGEQQRLGSALSGEAKAIEQGPQFSTPHQVRAQKTAYDRETYKGGPGTPESYAGQASAAAGNEYRGMLRDYVGQAGPATADRFAGLNDAYGTAATLQGATAEGANKAAAAGGWVAPAIGAAAGGMLAGPFGVGLGAAAGYGARKAGSMYGADLGANVARLAQNGAGAVNDAAQLANDVGAPNLTARAISALSTRRPSGNTPGIESDAHAQGERSADSQGQNLKQNIERALANNPQVFGPYLQQFQQAQSADERTAIAERLALDPKDTNFRRTILPLLTGASR